MRLHKYTQIRLEAAKARLQKQTNEIWSLDRVIDHMLTLAGEPRLTAVEQPSAPTKFEKARGFLLEYLADGPKLMREVRAAAAVSGVKIDTLRRAKAFIGIHAIKTGGLGQPWAWELPVRT